MLAACFGARVGVGVSGVTLAGWLAGVAKADWA